MFPLAVFDANLTGIFACAPITQPFCCWQVPALSAFPQFLSFSFISSSNCSLHNCSIKHLSIFSPVLHFTYYIDPARFLPSSSLLLYNKHWYFASHMTYQEKIIS